ncbi:hypothetical protein ACFL59_11355 [Planctomycetota bacterium]
MEATTPVLLEPVVGLRPSDPESLRRPNGTYADDAVVWSSYWKTVLQTTGYSAFEPVVPGTNLVRPESLSDDDLRLLVEVHLGPLTESGEPVEETIALNGGLALYVDGVLRLRPQCCCHLSDIHGWAELLDPAFDKGSLIWEGHPDPLVETSLEAIVLKCDDGDRPLKWNGEEWRPFDDGRTYRSVGGEEFSMPAEARIVLRRRPLRSAVETAADELRRLSERLRRVLPASYSDIVCRRLVWYSDIHDTDLPVSLSP